MGKWEANLPGELEPEGEICVVVKIPAHPDYVSLFLRAVRMLEVNRNYERDDAHSAAIVCEQWRNRTINPLIEALATGNGCPEDINEFDCIEYPAFASFVEFVPDNPYDPDAPVPTNYLNRAWWRWGKLETVLPDWIDNPIAEFIEDLTQYHENDAFAWLGSLPYNGIGEIIDNAFPFPYVKLHVTGSGKARINLLSFPLGGRVFVEVDEIPNIIDILTSSFLDPDSRVVDTDRDVETFPMEQWPLNSVVVDVEGAGDHIIYCMLMPRVEVGVDFFGFGAGIRSVELCGGLRPLNVPEPPPPPLLEGVEELKPDFRFTEECGLEFRLVNQEDEVVQDWTPVEGWVASAAACFNGEDGIDGIDGTNGVDGVDGVDGNGNTNVEPPSPQVPDAGGNPYTSASCQSSYYAADKLIGLVAEIWADMSTITLAEFIDKFLAVGGFDMDMFEQLWGLYFALSNPDIPTDALAERDRIAEWFFCGELVKQAVIDNCDNDTGMDSNLQGVLGYALRSLTQAKLNQWAYTGSKAYTENQCEDFCTWQVRWVFIPGLEPVEGVTDYPGDTWSIYAGEFVPGFGYSSTTGAMTIQHNMPKDCRITDFQYAINRHEACSSLKHNVTWRGLSGTDAEAQTGDGTIISPTLTTAVWDLHNAEMSEMIINTENHTCLGSGDDRERIAWIYMAGTGAKPRA
jgi:hypothetical protein